MLSLEQLYGEVNNLKGLVHPLWQRSFQYMSDSRAIALARQITDCIVDSGRRLVVVAETGASPLGEICLKIGWQRGYQLKFVSLKIPREPAEVYLQYSRTF